MTDSRNLRLRNSLGRYIARLDADDTLRPNVFADKVAILDANPDAVMVYGPTQMWFSWAGGRRGLHRRGRLPLRRQRIEREDLIVASGLRFRAQLVPLSPLLKRSNQPFSSQTSKAPNNHCLMCRSILRPIAMVEVHKNAIGIQGVRTVFNRLAEHGLFYDPDVSAYHVVTFSRS